MAIEMYKGMNLTGTPSWHGTRDEYDNLAIHDPNTMYFIEDETGSCILWKGTREMFNNLPSEYKNDNTLYVITDESFSVDSEEVSYDNATSGLTSTNVQDAIDEVNTKVNTLPKPMQYKGTLGTGGTIQTLPAVSEENYGFVYKVITNGTYASQSSKIGDMFISNGTEWTYIPSGDDASSFSALTDTNISNPSNGQMPIYDATSGLWKNEDYIKEVTYATWQTMTDEQKANGKYIVSDYPTVTTAPIIDNQTTASNVWSGQKINSELGNKVNTSDYSGNTLKTSVSKTGSGSAVTNSIAAETSMDTVIGTLLNNDYALSVNLTTSKKVKTISIESATYIPNQRMLIARIADIQGYTATSVSLGTFGLGSRFIPYIFHENNEVLVYVYHIYNDNTTTELEVKVYFDSNSNISAIS